MDDEPSMQDRLDWLQSLNGCNHPNESLFVHAVTGWAMCRECGETLDPQQLEEKLQ